MELMEQQEIADGILVTIHDHSKRVAADRWLVKIRCEATVPLPAACVDDLVEEDAGLKAMVLARLGDRLTFAVVKERNFIDAREKEAVLAGLVANVRENVLGYLVSPQFPARLFAGRYAELRQGCVVERHYQGLSARDEEDEGPADFSDLFRK